MQQQQQQQPPQSQPQPPISGPSFSPTAITTEQIQKCLDDNKNLIMAILENQNLGKFQECAQLVPQDESESETNDIDVDGEDVADGLDSDDDTGYQHILQKNLMYLAAIADAQPPAPTPQTSTPSQMPTNSIPQQANNYMQQQQQQQGAAAAASQQSQHGAVPKLPFQLNSLRNQDQQQQLLQFQQQQQQQQQLQAQMGMRAGAQNGMLGMHQAMQSALAGNPMDGRGGSEAASGGDGQGKSRS